MARHAPPALRLVGDADLIAALTATLSVDHAGTLGHRRDGTAPTLLTASTPDAALAPLPAGSLQLLCATPSQARQRATLQAALLRAGQPFGLVLGDDLAHCGAAIGRAWQAHCASLSRTVAPADAGWRHTCARCGDGDCERRLFRALLSHPSPPDEPHD